MRRKSQYVYSQSSTRPKTTLQKIGSISLEVIRIIVAIVFIFSGFVKAIDPLGSTYKFQDYFTAFGGFWGHFTVIALPLAIALSTFELLIGLSFLTKTRMKLMSILAFCFMCIMLPLTLYVALKNPVTDCGCFGDALIITNWQTFYKNIVLIALIGVVALFQKRFKPIFLHKSEWVVVLIFILIGLAISTYSYMYLPPLDFRPYKVGVNIPEAMTVPAGKPTDKYETVFIYEKEGVQKEFNIDNYPQNDSTWVFVDQKTTIIEKGYTPPIHNFNIVDADFNDITDDVLNHEGEVKLLILYDVNKASKKGTAYAETIYQQAMEQNIPFYALTASSDDDINTLREETGITFPFYKTDPITLKTIIRANPGLMTIEHGTIKGKKSWRCF